jgi:hypothetical protein
VKDSLNHLESLRLIERERNKGDDGSHLRTRYHLVVVHNPPRPVDRPTPRPVDRPTPRPVDRPTPRPVDRPTYKEERKGLKKGEKHTHHGAAPAPVSPVAPTGETGDVRVPPPPPPQEPKAEPQSLPVPAPAPSASLKRCEEFISRYPDRGNAEDTRREYMRANTPATEEACHACLDRYLASDQVHRGILMRASRWLREQRGNNWAGDWQRPRTRTEIDERAADFARRMREERSRAGKR